MEESSVIFEHLERTFLSRLVDMNILDAVEVLYKLCQEMNSMEKAKQLQAIKYIRQGINNLLERT